MRRLRQSGQIPAVLYGHNQATVHLAIKSSDVHAAIRHGQLLVKLQGDFDDSALIKHVQWDLLGSDVLHLDLLRVDVTEKIEVDVAVELRGSAPGQSEGGVVTQHVHEVTIECMASNLPEKLQLNINELNIGQSRLANEIDFPEGVTYLGDPELVIVSCAEPLAELEDEEDSATAEPEVIGRPDAEKDEADDE